MLPNIEVVASLDPVTLGGASEVDPRCKGLRLLANQAGKHLGERRWNLRQVDRLDSACRDITTTQ